MVRVQTLLPYFILVIIFSCLLIVLYASRPAIGGVTLQRNQLPFTLDQRQQHYEKKPSTAREPPPPTFNGHIDLNIKDPNAVLSLYKSKATNERDKENEVHYLKEIQLGDDTVYRPVNLYKPSVEEKFTIIIQTFNRTDLLMRVLNHYSAVHGVDRIIIVWNTMGEEPPYEWWEGLQPHPTEVLFLEQKENKVRNRLYRFPEIRTDGVLMLDDDHLYATRDVEFAFRVWKQYRNKLVGFVARKHVEVSDGVYVYGDLDMNTDTPLGGYVYSFVLVGATFFHADYLDLFNSDEVPYGVHQLIDKNENCDDLAFNFMVGRHLSKTNDRDQCVGLYVSPTVTKNIEKDAKSGYTGKWKKPEHFATRTYCINALAKLYSGVPLPYCDMILTSYFDYTRLKHC